MLEFITFISILFITGYSISREFKFYILSFFFGIFYNYPNLCKIVGIKRVKDYEWKAKTTETEIYLSGIIPRMIFWLLNIEFSKIRETRKNFIKIQNNHNNNYMIDKYLDQYEIKNCSIDEFRIIITNCIIRELNDKFNIVDKENEAQLLNDSIFLMNLFEGVTGNFMTSLVFFMKNIIKLLKIRKSLGKIPDALKVFILIPPLTLSHNIWTTIILNHNNLSELQEHDFLFLDSRYFCVRSSDELVMVERHSCDKNTPQNTVFGPIGFQCPANNLSFKIFKSFINYLKNKRVHVTGETPIIHHGAVNDILNKSNIFITIEPVLNKLHNTYSNV